MIGPSLTQTCVAQFGNTNLESKGCFERYNYKSLLNK